MAYISAEKHAQASGAAALITKAAKKVVMEKKKKEAREAAKPTHLGSVHTTKLQAPFNSGDWSHTGEVRIHWAGLCLFMEYLLIPVIPHPGEVRLIQWYPQNSYASSFYRSVVMPYIQYPEATR